MITSGAVAIQVAFGYDHTLGAARVAALPPREVAQPTRGVATAPATAIGVNRTVPPVRPPKKALSFSANPTQDDFLRTHTFEEPLVPVGGQPSAAENSALAMALLRYSQRAGPNDFSSLTEFLDRYGGSPWGAALLTDLGLEYYNTAHYSLALEAWTKAWALAKKATDPLGKAIGDRAAGELAYMYARIGRMNDLDALLQSVEGRRFVGPATEKISGAQAGLWNMKNRPEIAFRCGPLALHQIKLRLDPQHPGDPVIYKSASTQQGFSLPQVAELSKRLGLNFHMAFREKGAAFVVPSVVHWKVGHYAALVRQEGDRYLLEDPTFRNDVWATREALETESSGYFLLPGGTWPNGWRTVDAKEGEGIWGKGNVCCNDPGPTTPCDPKKQGDTCPPQPSDCPSPTPPPLPVGGMAIPSVHLMVVSLNIVDEPVGYNPPVGPPVRFIVTYNQRDAFQPTIFSYANFGPKWTCRWVSYITDNPFSPLANVNYYVMGGGTRTFTGFNTNTRAFASQQYDQTLLTRTGAASYQLLMPDGSRRIFSQPDGSIGTSRKVFLSQVIDPAGNAVTLTYDANLRLVALTDAIGQVTTISYEHPADIYKITKVTDPFGRFATFDYDASLRLVKITDVIGLTSQFVYDLGSDFINTLTTPYGNTSFIAGQSGTTRWLETVYPDGNRDRVEFNESTTLGIPASVPAALVPTGMATHNDYLYYRNTYYWSKSACSLGYGDYTKAKIYHWLHTADMASASGILESTKEALEGRVWRDYAGQSDPIVISTNNLPSQVGRVLDDGTTQLYTYEYNGFGHVTRTIDPVGRTFSYVYSTNGIDLLEVRQTRAGNNELLVHLTYNSQHLPLTMTDAAGQATIHTYNPRGQLLTKTNPKGETTTYNYDPDGYLRSVDGPLPGTNDSISFTYDALGRVHTKMDESGYVLTYDYDALDRLTKITYPDSTFQQFTYTRLDRTLERDRAGRLTSFEYNNVGQMTKRTDPLGRVLRPQWCKCGDSKSLSDAMGRTTTWQHDVQGRVTRKEYADGSAITYIYEDSTSRVRQRIDEKLQVTQYSYNPDDALSGISYANAAVATPATTFTYDANYNRVSSMQDSIGITLYSYIPITVPPSLGAGQLGSVRGPLPDATITFAYDELGRRVSTSVDGVVSSLTFDAAGRETSETNRLGVFIYTYDGTSSRVASEIYPNGQTVDRRYGGNLRDQRLQGITDKLGVSLLSEFIYDYSVAADRVASWSQQAGTQAPVVYSFGYDDVNEVTSASVSQGATVVHTYGYTYDSVGNRLTEQVDSSTNFTSYNALNELTTTSAGSGTATTNEWDAEQRLAAVNAGNQRAEFTYDGLGRRVGIRRLVNGTEVSNRLFLWCEERICEERSSAGTVTKRFFPQGMAVETGLGSGTFYYTRDHLDSIRELTDASGSLRARYAYDPFGRRSRVAGDMDADFGFAGMLWSPEAGLSLTKYRAYDPTIGRWLSRDPLKNAEMIEGPNLFAYVGNDVVDRTDPEGLSKQGDYCRYACASAGGTAGAYVCGKCVALAAIPFVGAVAAGACIAATVAATAWGIAQCQKQCPK